MKINKELDEGPVCSSYKIKISDNDNAEIVSDNLASLAAEKILDDIDQILEDKIKFKEQNHKEATYASKIDKSESQINWSDAAENIIGKINGLYPNPGAFFIYKGERYKILKAELASGSGEVGDVLDDHLLISCGNKKSIKILEIQRQGKKPQKIGEFMLGSQIKTRSMIINV